MTEDSSKNRAAKEDRDEGPESAAQSESAEQPKAQPTEQPAEEPAGESGGSESAAATEQTQGDPETQIAELNDRLLRAVAELENFRRRAERQRQDTAKYAISGFARDCLTVLDNLRRGLDSVSAEDRGGNKPLDTLAEGMELTERELIAALERHGIKKVDPLGEAFDYDLHQAMFEVEDEEKPAGTVVQVVQIGYTLNDRLLRPAMVGVAKAKANGASESPEGDDDGGAGNRPETNGA